MTTHEAHCHFCFAEIVKHGDSGYDKWEHKFSGERQCSDGSPERACPEVGQGESLWSCSHCGADPNSDAGWCALGCGRDYNQMTKIQ